jgi:hypothetical protein
MIAQKQQVESSIVILTMQEKVNDWIETNININIYFWLD